MERNSTKTVKVTLSIPKNVLGLMKKTASEHNKSLSKYLTDLFLKELGIDKDNLERKMNSYEDNKRDDLKERLDRLRYLARNRTFRNELEYRRLFEETLNKYGLTRKELVDMIDLNY